MTDRIFFTATPEEAWQWFSRLGDGHMVDAIRVSPAMLSDLLFCAHQASPSDIGIPRRAAEILIHEMPVLQPHVITLEVVKVATIAEFRETAKMIDALLGQAGGAS